ncbi:LTA synthase family protein [Pelagicoccus sp. SDUM812003]|uniref:LTA synthase family protein n=1 Tax=Pelagicoccus sp. SDUM812003 TaxID=3041267 RepID=UPI00280D631F|nr:LTA synthase family protein [Pelagicoccus sp. SDUM812003]MDQ8202319.1 LTA synthase family protein [Pelagicoccus sp. SDUM812003]
MRRRHQIPRFRQRLLFGLWLLLCAAALLYFGTNPSWGRIKARHSNKLIVLDVGYFGYACFDTYRSIRNWIAEAGLALADAEDYRSYLSKIRTRRATTPRAAATPQRKHVIYLQMESVDGISVTADYQGEPVMPFLKSLTKRSIFLRNALDNSSSGRTTDGEFLALCSLPPIAGKPAYTNYELDKIPSMPRTLNAAGYYTFSLHGNNSNFWNRGNAHQSLGYKDSFYFDTLDQSERIGWGISDESALKQAALKIKAAASDGPVFAHLILLTNHHPYHHVGERLGEPKNDLALDHIDSIRYVDRSIQSFFESLESFGILEDCVIAIFSDHDSAIEPLLKKAYTNEDPPICKDTIPVILYGLDRPAKTYYKMAGLQDVPVIVLDSLGIEIPHTFTGNTLDTTLPTLNPKGLSYFIEEQSLHKRPIPVNVSDLTKLALRYPEKLQPK